MPLLTPAPGSVVVAPPAPVLQFPYPAQRVTAQWFSPNGTVWDLTAPIGSYGVALLDGVAGLGAAPRQSIRHALATGGTYGRWSYADERIITLPLIAPSALYPAFARSITVTTPAAGRPSPGRLRVTNVDGTWREVKANYLGGLENVNDSSPDGRPAVVQLFCPEPWFYGEASAALTFDYVATRSYFSPYETVTPNNEVGTSDAYIDGDVAARPVWTLLGPGSLYTVTAPSGSFTYQAGLAVGQSVVVDVEALTVVDNTGANVIGNLSWPGSKLFTLPAGAITITVAISGAGSGAGVHLSYRPCFELALP